MKELLKKKLDAVKSLEERAALKELIEQVILPMAEYQEEQWAKLRSRIFDEIRPPDEDSHEIVTGICDRKEYDPVHAYLSPILPPETPDLAAVQNALLGEAPTELFSVYIDARWENALALLSNPPVFEADLHTDKSVLKGSCTLVPDAKHKAALRDVYRCFVRHDLPWKTVNTAYIDRTANVMLTDWDTFPEGETLREIEVRFGELKNVLRHDMILLWNVKRINMKSMSFAFPHEDNARFEHRIAIAESEAAHGYLVSADENAIRSVRREATDLIVTTDAPKGKMWDVFKIVRPRDSRMDAKMSFPVFSNRRRQTFTDMLAAGGANVFSKGEVLRLLGSYDFPVRVHEAEVTDGRYPPHTHGDMNAALDEAFSYVNTAGSLRVSFDTDGAGDFAEDMIRFLMSELQMKFPHYRCVGVPK
jgi:hypothetical protein